MLVLLQLSSTSGAVPCQCFTKEMPWSQSPEGGHTHTHTHTGRVPSSLCLLDSPEPGRENDRPHPSQPHMSRRLTWEQGTQQLSVCHASYHRIQCSPDLLAYIFYHLFAHLLTPAVCFSPASTGGSFSEHLPPGGWSYLACLASPLLPQPPGTH